MLSLDVSKTSLAAAFTDPQTRLPMWECSGPNAPSFIGQLLARTPQTSPWVMEPTGRYSLLVAKLAYAAGRRVLLAPPREAKQFLASLSPRAKTDKLDARGLGLFALSRQLSPYPVRTQAHERLAQLLTARRGLSQSVARLAQQQQELPEAAALLQGAIADLKRQRKALDALIAAERAALPETALLEQVPGIGPVTAAAVALCLVSKQFSAAQQFVSYVGLDIQVRQSGQRKGQVTLTHQGDAELRRLLYLCAQASLRVQGSPFRAHYQRERAKGLSSTAALCAVARKMARLCWSLVRHRSHYDPARVYSQS